MSADEGLIARIGVTRSETFTLDIELEIEPATTVALLGPNGAGKSTTLDALAGIVPLDAGRITLAGRVLDDPQAGVFVPVEQRRVGVVFQKYLLFDHLDVQDNVAFGPAALGHTRRASRDTARRWLDVLDLTQLADRRPAELSGGQAQRVAVARALASEPHLLLLDEPLAALDIATRTRMRRTLVEHLGHHGGPRLLITHDPADAFLLADRIVVLEHGRVSQAGVPEDIRRRPATPYVAALAGVNLLSGRISGGTISLDGHAGTLQSADTQSSGAVLVTIHPNAVALHAERPHGSPRNAWSTVVVALEPLGDVTRVTLGSPLGLSVDITPASAALLALEVGAAIWASVKATEVMVTPA